MTIIAQRRRNPPKHVWIVVHDGLNRTHFSVDVYGRYAAKKDALADLRRNKLQNDPYYRVVKYVCS